MVKHVLSFGYFDDLNYIIGPIHIELESLDGVKEEILKIFKKHVEKYDELRYFFLTHTEREYNISHDIDYAVIEDIADDLLEKKYFVRNCWEKYYVIALALDYTSFEIFSKDCDKETIDWEVNNQPPLEDKNSIKNLDYNENPVIKLLRALNTT